MNIYLAKKGTVSGKAVYDKAAPLKLEPPQFHSFDVTGIVQNWVNNKNSNLGFVVRQLDLWDWDPEKTVLEIRYNGKVVEPPKQVSGLKVFHRKGQTFITWTEIDKLINKEKIQWKEFEKIFKEHGPRKGLFYRIYRHTEPITARNLHKAQFVNEIWPLSGYDVRLHEHVTQGENWMGLNPKIPGYTICYRRSAGWTSHPE